MNQKTIKLKIVILVLFLIGFEIVILSNIPKLTHPIIDDKKDDLNPITSSTGWEPEILRQIGSTVEIGYDLFVGDANNDGYNDIVTASYDTDDISLLLWDPDLEDWEPYKKKSFSDLTVSVTIGDTDNDGENDLVVGWYDGQGKISIFLWNTSILDWNDPITKTITALPGSIHVGDVNNDGDNDILVGGNSGDRFSCFFWNESVNNWDAEVSKILSSQVYDVFLGDANNDGFNDVVATLNDINMVSISTWNDSLSNWNSAIEKTVGSSPRNVFIEDANNDGFNDIAVINGNSNDFSILMWNDSISDWNGEFRINSGKNQYGISVSDANNDGYNDIVVGNQKTNDNDISIYTWNATLNNWNPKIQIALIFYPIAVFVEDVNNDGLNDIVSAGFSTVVSILLSYIDTPVLYSISPSVDVDGIVELNWSNVKGTTHYNIYRNTSYINSVDGMTPLETVTDSNCTDFPAMNGDYYYVVVAGDANGNSSISNCESVEVRVPLDAPQLYQIDPNPDLDGVTHLNWSNVNRATSYFIYKDISSISSVGSLTPIDTSTETNYTDLLTANNIYYYVVIASDGSIVSPISNCENVTVMMALNETILSPISPNPDHDGTIYLEWDVNIRATIYYIYRDVSFISSVNSLAPIDTTGDNYYYDTILDNDTYYYVIVAEDGFVNSSISNCEEITTDLSLNTPILDLITPNPNYVGVVDLNWDDIEGATIYYIFRDKNPITSPNSLIPIYTTIESNFTDTIYFNEIYYYVIVAGNGVVNSSISLNQDISILMPLISPNLVNVNEYGSNSVIIEWDEVPRSTLYYIYRDDTFITSIDHLVPIGVSSGLSFIDQPSQTGDYYYVVVASDGFINSSISNCGSLYFEFTPPTPAIPGYSINLILLAVLLCSVLIGIRRSKKK